MESIYNFCSLWSGIQYFLESDSNRQEIHIQLYRFYPCCPSTKNFMGAARNEKLKIF